MDNIEDFRFIERIKDTADIISIIKGYIPLVKKGSNHWAQCPFTKENKQSFQVNPTTNTYRCFDCGAEGDVINFVAQIQKITYGNAVATLAEKLNLPVQQTMHLNSQKKFRTRDALNAALMFYTDNLAWSEAETYLKNIRGLDDEAIDRYGLGYSPNNPKALLEHLVNLDFTEEDLLSAGLISLKSSSGEFKDLFCNRIMLPIFDRHHLIVGFAARNINDGDGTPKYIVTPESTDLGKTLYDSSEILFGLNFASDSIKKTRQVYLAPGYFDSITARMIGMENVVSTGGLEFSELHATLLKDAGAEKVIFIPHDNEKGVAWAKKAARVAYTKHLSPLFAIIRNEIANPDDFISDDYIDADEPRLINPEIIDEAMNSGSVLRTNEYNPNRSVSVDLDTLARRTRNTVDTIASMRIEDIIGYIRLTTPDTSHPDDQSHLIDEIMSYLGTQDSVRKMLWIKKISNQFNIDHELLVQKYLSSTKRKNEYAPFDSRSTTIIANYPLEREAEIYIANLLTVEPDYAMPFFEIIPVDSEFFNPQLRELYKLIKEEYTNNISSHEPFLTIPLKAQKHGQYDFVNGPEVDKAFEYLKNKFNEKKLSQFPESMIYWFRYGIPDKLDDVAKILYQYAKRPVVAMHLNHMIESFRSGNEKEVELSSRVLRSLMI